jgi:hypothetical protein
MPRIDDEQVVAQLLEARSLTEQAHDICFNLKASGSGVIRLGEDPHPSLQEALRIFRKLLASYQA